jgi:hypothetical protein
LAQLVPYLAYVAVGRGGAGGQEREAVVLAGEAVGGVHVAVAARAEGGLVGAAEHARHGRLARGTEHLHRPDDAAGRTMHPLIRVVRGGRSAWEAWRSG